MLACVSKIGSIAVVAAGLCFAQQFEVASVKLSGTPPSHAYTIDSARVELGGSTVQNLIQMAYKLESYQVDGPAWIATTRFDIQAKLPPGGSKEQVPQMVRAMLAER